MKVVVLLAASGISQYVMAAGGVIVDLRKTYSGNIGYVSVGASFHDTPNSIDSCSFVSPMSSTVTLNIPVGATILDAYLNYAGSGDIGPNYHISEIDLSNQTSLTLNGVSIPTSAGFNDTDFPNLTAIGSDVVDFFSARRVSGHPRPLLIPLYKSDRIGELANFSFHNLGVSSSISLAG